MEEQLERLNNKLSHKKVDYIEIYGSCNSNGVITQVFSETMKYDEQFDYYVSLITAELSSFFPNIIEGKNNMFYYTSNNEEKVIQFNSGAYEIEHINQHIQDILRNDDIKIELDKGNGKSKIFLKQGYSVDFTKE